MPKLPDEKLSANPSSSNSDGDGSTIMSPDISEKGKPRQSAIKDAGMAREIVKNHIAAAKNRQIINSRIVAKVNAEKPYDQCKLDTEGLGWRSNFTSKPMGQMLEKAYPRLVEAVNGLKYFSNSSLGSEWENATVKTEWFRTEITKLIRARVGWRDLVEAIAFDNTLFGSAVVARLDESGWFPQLFKQEEYFLSDGTKQLAHTAQVVVLRETYFPHELFESIKDRDAAEAAGWNLEATIKQINKASPAQLMETNVSGNLDVLFQNMIREMTLGVSYQSGASVVVVYSLLVQEVGGKVSHYRLAGPEMELIFEKEKRFDSMADVVTFFAFQRGNGTMAGSKGLGRELYELCGMIDRIRNEVVDRSIMSGKIIVQGDLRQLHKFKMSVLGMTCYMPREWQISEQKFQGAPEEFLRLDAYFNQIIDSLVGTVSTTNITGGGEALRSAAAINVLASREEEQRDSKLSRFLEFFVVLVTGMQKRICNPDVDDDDAKDFQKRAKEIMSPEELKILANQPAASVVRDLTSFQRQMVAQIAQEKRGNPLYNQRALEIEDMTARVSADFADRVLLPVEDPTEQAEQSRLQMLELTLLSAGQAVPVSPRDNHEIHAQILQPVLEEMAGALQQGQTGTATFEAAVAHLQEHSQQAAAAGGNRDFWKPIDKFLKDAAKTIGQLKSLDSEAEALAGESAAHDEELAAEAGAPPVA